MAADYKFECDQFFCGYYFTTSGSWEFYRDEMGNKCHYGHPGPLSKEAEESGIWGYSDHMHCLDCDKSVEIIVSEIPNRFREKNYVWEWPGSKEWFRRAFYFLLPNSQKLEYKYDLRCPSCGGSRVVSCESEGIKCPRCKEGHLVRSRGAVY